MNLEIILLCLVIFFNFLNLLVLFFASVFLVRFRNDLVNRLTTALLEIIPSSTDLPSLKSGRTWDQKYEDELESASASRRVDQDKREII